jgi:hypothetical protein
MSDSKGCFYHDEKTTYLKQIRALRLSYEISLSSLSDIIIADEQCIQDTMTTQSQRELLSIECETISFSLQLLRNSYAISAYHLWENAVCLWHNRRCPNEKTPAGWEVLKKFSQDIGYCPDKHLQIVKDITNILKHGSVTSANALLKESERGQPGWQEILTLDSSSEGNKYFPGNVSAVGIYFIFDAVENSCPQ